LRFIRLIESIAERFSGSTGLLDVAPYFVAAWRSKSRGPDTFRIARLARSSPWKIVDDRVGNASTAITSQLPVDNWHTYLGEPTIADAILDRLVQSAHRIALSGEPMRKLKAQLELTAI